MNRLGAFNSNQPLVEAVVEEAQLVGVESHLGQYGRVQVPDVETILDGMGSELIGLPDADTSLDASARHEHRETVGVVVSPRPLGVFSRRLATELAAPDNQGLIEHTALLEILDQPGDRLVCIACMEGMVALHSRVSIPIIIVVGAA